MTRNRHDLFAKQHLEALLETVGNVTSSRKIASETREVDILFIPHESVQEKLNALGILGKIAKSICLIEPFRNAVTDDEILSCIGKLIDFTEESRRKAKREKRRLPKTELPWLWILSPTVPQTRVDIFAATEKSSWPSGFYFLPQPFRTALVAIHQLPVSEGTLWLRLMGRGKVQKKAVAELLALPAGHPMKHRTMEHLAVLQISLGVRQNLDSDEQEIAMNLTPVYEQWRRETLQEGKLALIIRLLTRQIGLISPELEQQVQALSLIQLDDLGEALLDFTVPSDLNNWLQSHQ
jgi:hypothetical protein